MGSDFGEPLILRNRKGGLIRRGNTQEASLVDRDLRASVIAKTIRELADEVPPLTAEQRLKLAALLVGGDR